MLVTVSAESDAEREERLARQGQGEDSQESVDEVKRAEAAAHAVQQGERWLHTYLVIGNIKEAERDKIMTRPLLY